MINYAPEGTRKKVEVWKSGFLHVAENRNTPIIVAILDFKKKIVELKEVIERDEFLTDGEIDHDKMTQVADKIRGLYKDVSPKKDKGANIDFKIGIRGRKY